MLYRALLTAAVLGFSYVGAIWPIPKTISTGDVVLFIDQTIEVTYNGKPVR